MLFSELSPPVLPSEVGVMLYYLKSSRDDFGFLAQDAAHGVEVFVADLCVQLLRGVQLQLLGLGGELLGSLALLLGGKLFGGKLHVGCQKNKNEADVLKETPGETH